MYVRCACVCMVFCSVPVYRLLLFCSPYFVHILHGIPSLLACIRQESVFGEPFTVFVYVGRGYRCCVQPTNQHSSRHFPFGRTFALVPLGRSTVPYLAQNNEQKRWRQVNDMVIFPERYAENWTVTSSATYANIRMGFHEYVRVCVYIIQPTAGIECNFNRNFLANFVERYKLRAFAGNEGIRALAAIDTHYTFRQYESNFRYILANNGQLLPTNVPCSVRSIDAAIGCCQLFIYVPPCRFHFESADSVAQRNRMIPVANGYGVRCVCVCAGATISRVSTFASKVVHAFENLPPLVRVCARERVKCVRVAVISLIPSG